MHTTPAKFVHLCRVDKEAQEKAWKAYNEYRARNSMSLKEELEMQEEFIDEDQSEEDQKASLGASNRERVSALTEDSKDQQKGKGTQKWMILNVRFTCWPES